MRTPDMKRGVVIDHVGSFIAAWQWNSAEETPRVTNTPRQGQKRMRPEDMKYLITDPEAIEDPQPNGRYDRVAKVWRLPDTPVWIVRQRRDIPHYWVLTGKRMIWLDRPPVLPQGAAIVTEDPGQGRPGKKPIWNSDTKEWMWPRRVALLDENGVVTNIVPSYSEADRDANAVDFDDPPTGTDEAGRVVRAEVGDAILPTVKINRVPRYRDVPVARLLAVLDNLSLTTVFEGFLTSKGLGLEDFRDLGTVSLRNRLLREFVESQGWTMKQAASQLERPARLAESTKQRRMRDAARKL